MIILICNDDENGVPIIDHGRDSETDELIIMPQIDVRYVSGAYFDVEIGEWILK